MNDTKWSVDVEKIGESSGYRALFKVGAQSFVIAEAYDADEVGAAQPHCQFMKRTFVFALAQLGVHGRDSRVNAPWDADQIKSLNGYQKSERWHPYTGAQRQSDGEPVLLIATPDGWIEHEGGPVVQMWALDFTVNFSWCEHEKCNPPNGFDSAKAQGMTAPEVRKAFPRFWGECPDCGVKVIKYVSTEHYVYGDW